jgi:hypothetical protein
MEPQKETQACLVVDGDGNVSVDEKRLSVYRSQGKYNIN